MARYILLAQSEVTAYALGVWLELIGEDPICKQDSNCIIWQESALGGNEKTVLAYDRLVRRIEETAADTSGVIPLNEVVVLVDAVNPIKLNPMAVEDAKWNSLVAMLILTFPEIRWVFGVCMGNVNESLAENHSLYSLLANPRRDPLFDPTGLRNDVRQIINDELKKSVLTKNKEKEGKIENEKLKESLLPTRQERAAAIDEESHYALFHAYTAYRFGFRADAVRSWALMKELFSGDCGHGFDLLLEDVNLNFPDKPEDIHLSKFQDRARHCQRLGYQKEGQDEDSSFRIIVTSGHSGADTKKIDKNKEYIEENKKNGSHSGFVLKPVRGMFDLWIEAKLFDRLDPGKDPQNKSRGYNGQAPGFYWPTEVTEEAAEAGGHSAPGKLMLLAQNLLRRADFLRSSANTVDECIHGAVLATDALELLRYQTPTLALQALCLKHEYEVCSEVAFLGVGHHFILEPRLDELEREVEAASRFFEKKRRKAAKLDTLVSIGNRLMLVFREAGQFDEELICLARIRNWHRKLQLRTVRNPFDFIFQIVMAYVEWLLARPWRFFLMLFFWFLILVFSWLQFVYVKDNILVSIEQRDHPLVSSASSAWNTFVANNPNDIFDAVRFLLNTIASALGLVHLGVFIAYLYTVVTRK